MRLQAQSAVESPSLFPKPIFVFVGPTGAGKSTAAEVLESRRGTAQIEASHVMRELAQKHGIVGATPFETAQRLIDTEGRDVIAREIAGRMSPDREYTISGFRLAEEVAHLREAFPDRVRLIYLDEPEGIRLARIIARGRAIDDVASIDDLRTRDREQGTFGLLPLARRFAEHQIDNEGTLVEFYQRIISIFDGSPSEHHGRRYPGDPQRDQFLRCLQVLRSANRPMSCDEIAAAS